MGLAAFNRMRRLSAAQNPAVAEPDEPETPKTAEELRAALSAAGVAFVATAKKAELQALYEVSLGHDA